MDDITRKLLKQYEEHKDDPRVFRGQSAAVAGGGRLVAGVSGDQGGALSRQVPITGDVNWHQDLPALRKRSLAQRAESLANRFWAAVKDHDPAQTELMLKMLYQDSWKVGQPISYDEVKQVAINLLRQQAAKSGGSY